MRNPSFGGFHVEHRARTGVLAFGNVHVRRRLRRGRVLISRVAERQRAIPRRTTYLSVVEGPAVQGCDALHLGLNGSAGALETVAEVLAARERCRVHLHLKMALVRVPVPDLDREGEEQDDRRHQEADKDDHASLLGTKWVAPIHGTEHVPEAEKCVAWCSSRIVALPLIVIVRLMNGMNL